MYVCIYIYIYIYMYINMSAADDLELCFGIVLHYGTRPVF